MFFGGTHAKMRMRTIDTKTLDSYRYARTHFSPVQRHFKHDQDQHQILSRIPNRSSRTRPIGETVETHGIPDDPDRVSGR